MFEIQAGLGTNLAAVLLTTVVELTTSARLAQGSDQGLVLVVIAPAKVTQNVGAETTIVVGLTATPE